MARAALNIAQSEDCMGQIEKLYCLGCGAALPTKVRTGRIKCEFCGTVYVFNSEHKHDDNDLTCPQCGSYVPNEAEFYGNCGAALYQICPKCGSRNPDERAFCVKCGTDLRASLKVNTQNAEAIYQDYLRESTRLIKEYRKSSLVFIILGFVLVIIGLNGVLFSSSIESGSALSLFLLIAGYFVMLISSIINQSKIKNKAASLENQKTGFKKFHSIYSKWGAWGWPKHYPDGDKRTKFLTLIGRN
jgi:ribosomal protein L40E